MPIDKGVSPAKAPFLVHSAEINMGFDFDRSEADRGTFAAEDLSPADTHSQSALDVVNQALNRNLAAEHFAISAYREIAAHGEQFDKATLRLVKVALAVEEEHAEILSSIIERLRDLGPGAPRP
jgi:rubrerythrin